MLLLLLLVVGFSSTCGGSEAYPRLPTFAKPLHYDVFINPDVENLKIHGTVRIDVLLMEPTDFVRLHAGDMTINNASYRTLDSQRNRKFAKVEIEENFEFLTLSFPEVIQGGHRVILNIDYTGKISDKLHGMYRSSYKKGAVNKYLIVTQFESTHARLAFPCWDEPLFKAQFTISLDVDANLTALSNMAESRVERRGTRKTVIFERTPLMSTYLVAIAVGDLEFIEGRAASGPLVRVYSTPGKKLLTQLALQYHLKAFTYYNDLFDYPYPMKKCDVLAVPDFAAGGMENWGLITFREDILVFNESTASNAMKLNTAALIGHEVGHFWFGNLVTMKWWDHLWLKEDFASFLAMQFTEDNYPELGAWESFLRHSTLAARRLDSLSFSHPIQFPVDNPAELPLIYDEVTYTKSCHIIRMLYLYIGRQKFLEGLRKYINKHQYSSTQTDDLWNAFGDVTGKDIKSLMSGWTKQIGYPVVTVSINETGALSISQERYLAKGDEDSSVGPWQIPVNLLIFKNNVSRTESFLHASESANQLLSEKIASADFVQVNPRTSGFYHVKYDAPVMMEKLLKAYGEKKIDHVNRFTLLTDTRFLVKAGFSPIDELLDLIEASSNENSSLVLSVLSSTIHYNMEWLERSNDRELQRAFKSFIVKTFKNASQAIGWTKRAGESPDTLDARYYLKNIMVNAGDLETIIVATFRFESIKYAPELDPILLKMIAEAGASGAQQILDLYKTSNNSNDKQAFASALGYVTDKEVLKKVHEFIIQEENVRAQDFGMIIASLAVTPQCQEATWEFVKMNWGTIKSKYDSPVSPDIVWMLFGLHAGSSSEAVIDEIRALFTEHELKTIERKLEELKELIHINARQEGLHKKALALWLGQN